MTVFVLSIIRTWVPIGVGALISWLTVTVGLPEIPEEGATGLIIFLTAVLQGAYYLLVRWLEQKFPQIGVLLGAAKSPDAYSTGDTKPTP